MKSSFKIVLKTKINFLLGETLLFFLEQKYILFSVLRHYKVALLLITQGDIPSVEQGISSAEVKPDRPIQNFD